MRLFLPSGPNTSISAGHAVWLTLMVSPAVGLPRGLAQENSAARQSIQSAASAKPADASRQLLAEFRQTYALPDDKVIKRVAPPFSTGRQEFYLVHESEQAKLSPKGPEYLWFTWDEPEPDDPNLTGWERFREGQLTVKGMGWIGGKGRELGSLVDDFTGIQRYEMVGERKLTDVKVSGDWVIRHGAAPDKILTELETILRGECKLGVRLRLVREDRKVIVAEGRYAYRPLPGRGTVNFEQGSEENGWLEGDYDVLEVFSRNRQDWWNGSYSFEELLARLSRSFGRPVLNEVARPPKNEFIVNDNIPRNSKPPKEPEWDETVLLKHLSEQTGLTFTEKKRRLRVLRVEQAD